MKSYVFSFIIRPVTQTAVLMQMVVSYFLPKHFDAITKISKLSLRGEQCRNANY
jgi:hypothetical protein